MSIHRPIALDSVESNNARLKARLDQEARLEQAFHEEASKRGLMGRIRAMSRGAQILLFIALLCGAGGAFAAFSSPPYRGEIPPGSIHLIDVKALAPGATGQGGVVAPAGMSVIQAVLKNDSGRDVKSVAFEITLRQANGKAAPAYVEGDNVKHGASEVVTSEPVPAGAQVLQVQPFTVRWAK